MTTVDAGAYMLPISVFRHVAVEQLNGRTMRMNGAIPSIIILRSQHVIP